MKVKVLVPFHDASDFSRVYEKDSVVDFTDARARELQDLGLVAPAEVEETVKKRRRKAR